MNHLFQREFVKHSYEVITNSYKWQQKIGAKYRNEMSPEQWREEFGTIILHCPRGIGHTTLVLQLMHEFSCLCVTESRKELALLTNMAYKHNMFHHQDTHQLLLHETISPFFRREFFNQTYNFLIFDDYWRLRDQEQQRQAQGILEASCKIDMILKIQ